MGNQDEDVWPDPNRPRTSAAGVAAPAEGAPPAPQVVHVVHHQQPLYYYPVAAPRAPSWWTQGRIAIVCVLGAGAVLAVALIASQGSERNAGYTDEDRCIDRGVRFYRDAKYEKFKDGTTARSNVVAKCHRDAHAFDFVDEE